MNIDNPVTIRRATPQHIPDLIWLGAQSPTAAHWSDVQYWSLFPKGGQNSRVVLIADCDLPPELRDEVPNVVGFLIAHHVAAEWELENIVVAEKFRGKGVGARLMQALLERIQQTNGESVFLEVRESNAAARKLYEKLGFAETGRRKSYYTNPLEDAVLYSKDLRRDRILP